jgi:hypothetical protein
MPRWRLVNSSRMHLIARFLFVMLLVPHAVGSSCACNYSLSDRSRTVGVIDAPQVGGLSNRCSLPQPRRMAEPRVGKHLMSTLMLTTDPRTPFWGARYSILLSPANFLG